MKTEILKPTEENIQRCADALMSGELVGMPTETVYGLAGCAFQESALLKIFESKARPHFDPLILHVALTRASTADLMSEGIFMPNEMSDEAVKQIETLIRNFWPGALTLVLPKTNVVPDLATSGLGTVAVRMPDHPVALDLIRMTDSPLCAPSANQFGRISPTTAEAVLKEMNGKIPYILDGGPCTKGIESTIIEVTEDGDVLCLRLGSLPLEEIEAKTKTKIRRISADEREKNLKAPGMLKNHYAPKKPFFLLERGLKNLSTVPTSSILGSAPKKIGLLAVSGQKSEVSDLAEAMFDGKVEVQVLSESQDWKEASQRLFAALRLLDESECEVIYGEPITEAMLRESGLAYAISDRIQKAARK
jgi:L-threonylcarbamoyladenylate synthase